MNQLTIFTPTYNRAYLLTNLYKSLCDQTIKNFKWLIIDDGSTDNTEEIVDTWKRHGEISILYYKQSNQGKHIAHNKAIEICDSELFFCVDSDDILTPNAVEIILDLNEKEVNSNILGFYLRKGDLNGIPVGENWPTGVMYTTLNELYEKYKYKGEAAIVLKTKLIKNIYFPKFNNEKFLRETVFFDQINNLAPMRLDNRVCYLFEYKEDGYTAQGMKLEFKNPIGTGYNYLQRSKYTRYYLNKCKYIGMFYAWKSLMKVDHPLFKTIKIPIIIRIFGMILKKHYHKLFSNYKERFINEI